MTGGARARACPVCASLRSARRWPVRDSHYGVPGEWWLRECGDCGSLFLEDPPSQDALTRAYAPDYYAYSVERISTLKLILQRALCYSKATREPEFASPGRVLDFGCGAGTFLIEMRERGWRCAGVEINAGARARAGETGLDVRQCLLGPHGFEPESFDYVRANHSLEHVLHPDEVLREMFAVLKPGGTLFVGVPTTTSQNARVFGPSWWHLTPPLHTFVPSTRGLSQLVERSGFHMTRVSTNGDYAGTAGSLQIALNRHTSRSSTSGIIFAIRPLLLVGHWVAKLQDAFGVGDRLELIATKPG
jgi:SAM-dependent methyltransferase